MNVYASYLVNDYSKLLRFIAIFDCLRWHYKRAARRNFSIAQWIGST